jgi:hypothetical protein
MSGNAAASFAATGPMSDDQFSPAGRRIGRALKTPAGQRQHQQLGRRAHAAAEHDVAADDAAVGQGQRGVQVRPIRRQAAAQAQDLAVAGPLHRLGCAGEAQLRVHQAADAGYDESRFPPGSADRGF